MEEASLHNRLDPMFGRRCAVLGDDNPRSIRTMEDTVELVRTKWSSAMDCHDTDDRPMVCSHRSLDDPMDFRMDAREEYCHSLQNGI